jgi:hydroxyethylthiazole kinase-like uncharacterized protein yjeF
MIDLLTPAEMTKVDARAIASGVTGRELMANAGAAVAAAALSRWPEAGRVLVLAGPGNNGGDGFVAACLIAEAGRDVAVALLGDRSALHGDAASAAQDWSGSTIALDEADPLRFDLVIDALFGAGLSRPLEGTAARAVACLAASGRPVLAVDVPSGLDGATGAPLSEACVRADVTVTFIRLKPGHVLLPGRELCGEVQLADIGAPRAAVDAAEKAAFLNRPALWRAALPAPGASAHKYSRGHVAVWSGAALATGASRLAATAALRAGAGAATLLGNREALLVHATHVTAIMLHVAEEAERFSAFVSERRVRALVVGPGAGVTERTRAAIVAALDSGAAAVLDADVFTLFAGRPDELARLIAEKRRAVVLTPHEGEFARLFAGAPDEPAGSKLDRSKQAAARLGATIILKGADTVVASADGRASIADNAPATLATAGAGDVLAGLCAGLLAQGMEAFAAASAAVFIHGEAARRVGPGLIADDLPGALPAAMEAVSER